MAIRDKDGSVYKLRGPNPVMTQQEVWDKKKLEFINFEFQEEVVKDEKGEVVIPQPIQEIVAPIERQIEQNTIPFEIPETPLVIEEPVVVEPTPPKIEQKPEPPKPEPKVEKPVSIPAPQPRSEASRTSGDEPPLYSNQEVVENSKIVVYCLPVFEEVVKDAVFGTSTKVNRFGQKVTMEALMVEEEDLFCVFWTPFNVPVRSVVYPRNYSKRWWQVQETKPEGNGFLVTAVPTHANPDFTD